MTDDEVRRYWCERIGSPFYFDDDIGLPCKDTPEGVWILTDADLAMAVRAWWLEQPTAMTEAAVTRLALILLRYGPIAFLRAVMEMVDD